MKPPTFCFCDSKSFLALITIFSIFAYIISISLLSLSVGFDPKIASGIFFILLEFLFLYGVLKNDTAFLRIMYWFSTIYTIFSFILLISVPVAVAADFESENHEVHGNFSKDPDFYQKAVNIVWPKLPHTKAENNRKAKNVTENENISEDEKNYIQEQGEAVILDQSSENVDEAQNYDQDESEDQNFNKNENESDAENYDQDQKYNSDAENYSQEENETDNYNQEHRMKVKNLCQKVAINVAQVSHQLFLEDLEEKQTEKNKMLYHSRLIFGYQTTAVLAVIFILAYTKHSIIGDVLRYAEYLQTKPLPVRLMTY